MDDRLALLGIGVLGLGLSALAVVRLVRPQRRLRPNDRESARQEDNDIAEYNWWMDKVCPSRKPCADAKDQVQIEEDNCLRAESQVRDAKKIAESALSDAKLYVDMDKTVTRMAAESARKAWERVLALKGKLRSAQQQLDGMDPDSAVAWHMRNSIVYMQEDALHARADYEYAAEDLGMKLEVLGANEEAITQAKKKMRDAAFMERVQSSGIRECWDRWQANVTAAEEACRAFKICAKPYPTFLQWREKRVERQERRVVTDPLAIPMRAKETQFGVEMEVVLPDLHGHGHPVHDIAMVLAETLGVERGSRPPDLMGGDHIEFRDARSRNWKIVRDISLGEDGAEIVSPVLGLSDIPDVQKVARAVSKAGAVSSGALNAGLHVHVSHPTQCERMVPIAQAAVKLDASIPRHPHRGEEWAKPIPEEFASALQPGMTEADVMKAWYISQREAVPRDYKPGKICAGKQSQTRYTGVNLHALPYMGTFEVRAYDGTLDPDEIKRAILSAAKMVTARMYKNRPRRRRKRRAA